MVDGGVWFGVVFGVGWFFRDSLFGFWLWVLFGILVFALLLVLVVLAVCCCWFWCVSLWVDW